MATEKQIAARKAFAEKVKAGVFKKGNKSSDGNNSTGATDKKDTVSTNTVVNILMLAGLGAVVFFGGKWVYKNYFSA